MNMCERKEWRRGCGGGDSCSGNGVVDRREGEKGDKRVLKAQRKER